MIAITGGLLVARFVTIASEQDGADKLVKNARERLKTARVRRHLAREALRLWNVKDFFDAKVIHAIGRGEQNLAALRQVGDPTPLTDEELARATQTIIGEFEQARSTLQALRADREDDEFVEWEDFQRTHYDDLPETSWGDVWQDAYEAAVLDESPEPEQSRSGWGGSYGFSFPSLAVRSVIPPVPEYVVRNMNKRDALRQDVVRMEQQFDDMEAELDRLARERDKIVRPKGLGSGLTVLGSFTIVGIIVPLWIMSRGPARLTAHLGEVVLSLFLAGLLSLLGHMSWLALRLTRRRHDDEQQSDDPVLPSGISPANVSATGGPAR
jgi:hypothetical protein